MAREKNKRVREQVVVYLDEKDRALLEQMAEKTGLARTELFRRGLRRLAEDALVTKKPGWSLAYLIATATEDDDLPADLSERGDEFFYGEGYKKRPKSKRARPR